VLRPLKTAISSFDRAISFATRDAVTQLLNRDAFHERLAKAIDGSPSGGVICADLNQFSTINEVYGFAHGDALLRAVAQRIRETIGTQSHVARIYGGRFAIVARTQEDETGRAQVERMIDTLHDVMSAPFVVAGGVQPVTLSVGVATWPGDATDPDDLIGAAETAIHAMHRHGNDRTRWFASDMRVERRRFLEIEADLRRAVEQNEFTLHYQPKIRCSDQTTVGFEALLRWNHPAKGSISPAVFIPVAEQSNLIVDVGRWVLREVCRQQAAWKAQGLRILPIAVNFSPMQLLAHPLDELLAPLAEFGLSQDCIEIEITESAMMDKLPSANAVIDSLRRSGIHISIDDFGTGHSSLSNLRRLPIDTLKIDRSFVEDIEQSVEAYDIVATIVAMAKALSLDVVAEGVETETQAALLRSHGVDVMQGYLFARPMPGEAIAKLLSQHEFQPAT
jgi:diguanylate cyclase (GGDEF)-like protein